MCSARRLMVFNICVKFHENMSSSYGADIKIVKTQRAIHVTPKVGKSELRFMCSAQLLTLFNICVKFYKYVKLF